MHSEYNKLEAYRRTLKSTVVINWLRLQNTVTPMGMNIEQEY